MLRVLFGVVLFIGSVGYLDAKGEPVAEFIGPITLDGAVAPTYTAHSNYRNILFGGNSSWIGTRQYETAEGPGGMLFLGQNTYLDGSTFKAMQAGTPGMVMEFYPRDANYNGNRRFTIRATGSAGQAGNADTLVAAGAAQEVWSTLLKVESDSSGYILSGPSSINLDASGNGNSLSTNGDRLFVDDLHNEGSINFRVGASSPTTYLKITPSGTGLNAGKFLSRELGTGSDRSGTCTLSSGSCTVSTTLVTDNSHVFVTARGNSGNIGVTARTTGTSFTIASSNGSDSSVVDWFIVEPY